MLDPPWQLASATPTRGVALGYCQLSDAAIQDLALETLSQSGFLFLWVINNRFEVGLQMLEKWGYRFIDSIDWVKRTVNRRMAKSHGFYLQHAKETCLVGIKVTCGSATIIIFYLILYF
ncbi:N6-adenosine-methyltransferase subunit METTL3-like [Zophobas morio]|uniref:N6-adenosine-methyltransferase subunit METTL3-like n=1 Tax=Zophobas morio TaxID=2755281 RepID=UPI003082FBE0